MIVRTFERISRRGVSRNGLGLSLALAAAASMPALAVAGPATHPAVVRAAWGMHIPGTSVTWPQTFHDAGHTGNNPSESILSPSNVSQLRPIGGVPVPGAVSADAVNNGVLFAHSPAGTLTAISLRTGKTLWTTVTGFPGPDTVSTAGSLVYTTCELTASYGSYNSVCGYRQSDGGMVWSYTDPCQCGGTDATPPTYASGVVFFGYGLPYPNQVDYVEALNAATGAPIWQWIAGGANSLSGYTLAVGGNHVYVPTGNFTITGLSQQTGAPLWQQTTGSGENALTAVGDVVLDNVSGEPACSLLAFNGSTGKPIGSYTYEPNGCANFPAPASVGNGLIYVPDPSGSIFALNAKTGTVVWSNQLAAQNQPSFANGVLYVDHSDPNLPTISAYNAATGALLWNGPDTGRTLTPPPIVLNGVLFAADAGPCGDICAYTLPRMAR